MENITRRERKVSNYKKKLCMNYHRTINQLSGVGVGGGRRQLKTFSCFKLALVIVYDYNPFRHDSLWMLKVQYSPQKLWSIYFFHLIQKGEIVETLMLSAQNHILQFIYYEHTHTDTYPHSLYHFSRYQVLTGFIQSHFFKYLYWFQ